MVEPGDLSNEPRRDSGRRSARRVDLGKVLSDVLGSSQAAAGPKSFTNSIGMAFVLIPAGKFMMGSPLDDPGFRRNEGPQHEVVIGSSFFLGVHLVTQADFLTVMGVNPARFTSQSVGGLDHPVENVSWEDAMKFCRKLSDREAERTAGRSYTLPSEAQWEYACRAGSDTPFAFGTELAATQANFNSDVRGGTGRTTPIDHYPASAWGLHDMHGNVWEWCADWYGEAYYSSMPLRDPPGPAEGTLRVLRGGSWKNQARACRAAYRNALAPFQRDSATGFRCVVVAH